MTPSNLVWVMIALFTFRSVSTLAGYGPPFNVYTYLYAILFMAWMVLTIRIRLKDGPKE